MTNDTSTLNGALAELGETLADNLVTMGVTGASASDGLTTLAGKILNIAPSVGGLTPVTSIDLDYAPSNPVIGGNVVISAMVNADYDDTSQSDIDLKGYLQGATVTFSENGSTLGSAVTDINGVATFTITGITSGTHTITASFDGTGTDYTSSTATITITPTAQLFYDACDSATGLSNYGSAIAVPSGSQTSSTSYVSSENAYLVKANSDWGCLPITALTGLDNYKISAYFKPKGTSHLYRGGFGFLSQGTQQPYYAFSIRGNGECFYTPKTSSSEQNTTIKNPVPNVTTQYHRLEITKQGNTYTAKIYDSDDTTVIGTTTQTFTISNPICGLYLCCGSSYGCYVKEIKAEPI